MERIQHIFIIGAKGLGNYGGYETFVDKLTEYHQNNLKLKYHIACKENGSGFMNEKKLDGVKIVGNNSFIYHNAFCFKVHIPEKLGSAQAIYYDIAALKKAISFCHSHPGVVRPIFYILACRIGPFIGKYVKQIHKLGGMLYVNPDGHEWMREKWSRPVRGYWKESEKGMVKHADLLVCDSVNIEKYIKEEYRRFKPRTTFIAYGADNKPSEMLDDNPQFINWLYEKNLKKGEYYLVVGRFVSENNFEIMIKEFMLSRSKKDFAIITTSNVQLYRELDDRLHFSRDKRIKFVGTVYDQELLKKIRENAYGYIHGHSVGGTNPSLLEALGSTKLNLILNVEFNKEVGEDAVLYWSKKSGDLASLIDKADQLSAQTIEEFSQKAKERIKSAYSWQFIADRYEKIFGVEQ